MTPEQLKEHKELIAKKNEMRRQIESGELTGEAAEEASRNMRDEFDKFEKRILGRDLGNGPGHA